MQTFKTFVQVEINKTLLFWDQKFQLRNPLKINSLSENEMKEGERVLFQPFNCKGGCRGFRCGDFPQPQPQLTL